MRYKVAFLVFAAFVAGCAATGPQFQPVQYVEPETALVYLYRPSQFVGGGITPPVFVDNVKQFELPNNGYAEMRLSPGKHVIETRKDSNIFISDAVGSVELEVEAGETYYIKWLPSMSNFGVVLLATPVAYGSFRGGFRLVEETAALQNIAKCKKVYP